MTNSTMTSKEQELKDAVAKRLSGMSIDAAVATVSLSPHQAFPVVKLTVNGKYAYSVARQHIDETQSIDSLAKLIESEVKTQMKALGLG